MAVGISKYRSYQRIEQDLRRRVIRGEWTAGMLMPGRRELARQYGVDVNTLQRAIAPLLDDGLLIAEGKRGTFVGAQSQAFVPVGAEQNEHRPASIVRSNTGGTRATGKVIGVLIRIDPVGGLATPNAARTREAVRAIELAFAAKGWSTRLVNMEEEPAETYGTASAISAMRTSGADAVIVIDVFDNPAVAADLRAVGYSDETFTIYISSVGNYVPCPHIYFDQQHAGYVAAKELVHAGWQAITFLTPYQANWLHERVEGATMAVRQVTQRDVSFKTYPGQSAASQYDDDIETISCTVVREAFEAGMISGGIITPNDHIANIILTDAPRYGCILGRDFAVVGFDDDPASSLRGLTSVRPPFDDMGEIAADLVVKHFNGEPATMQICALSHLIPRLSTAHKSR